MLALICDAGNASETSRERLWHAFGTPRAEAGGMRTLTARSWHGRGTPRMDARAMDTNSNHRTRPAHAISGGRARCALRLVGWRCVRAKGNEHRAPRNGVTAAARAFRLLQGIPQGGKQTSAGFQTSDLVDDRCCIRLEQPPHGPPHACFYQEQLCAALTPTTGGAHRARAGQSCGVPLIR